MIKTIFFLMMLLPGFAIGQQIQNKNMTHILENKNLEIQIDLPSENYKLSRFDWTGKITSLKFKGVSMSGTERLDAEDENIFGKGFYNEFGIETAIGYNDSKDGDWFQKIGVGLLRKDDSEYNFSKVYEIQPADFELITDTNKLIVECKSQSSNGYSYVLRKEIELLESSFIINYQLYNTGEKTILTDEYNHNFLAINKELIGSQYILKFPFDIKPDLFGAAVNPEGKVEIGQNEITFSDTPNEQFFFSNLSGNENVDSSWELINRKSKLGIRETGSFKTSKINLWGWKHVISPELFFDVNVKPDQTIEWSRTYNLFEIN